MAVSVLPSMPQAKKLAVLSASAPSGWCTVSQILTAEHLKTLTRLMGGGYRGATDQLETLLGRPPKTVRWALENHPRIRKLAAA
ncbi:hypothetical protein OG542_09155 [Streptomyces violaceus]|uniref:hypothetical protein n=1 Tax=Streptomyces violaceus TaxID=1936 RepID=UPI002E23406C